ncbi:MAG: ribosome-associated translation inhibitor RaiA [Parachlamydiaceae bacterium]|nr:ribosome-associated translation inhibitor RaiA [Parachlamydiaceae bacterium]
MSRRSKAAEFVDEGYNMTVTGRNVSVTDAMKDYAQEKISKIERFTNRIIDVIVTMDVQKLEHRVDILLKLDHIKIKSQACCTDMYASIDKAVHKIETQLLKYRDKIRDHHAKGLPSVDMNVNVFRSPEEQALLDLNGDIEDETHQRLLNKYQPHKIVGTKTMPLKILTSDEAIMKMELSGDPFLIYRNEEDMKLKVIYRRQKDGNFGIIEPEA